MNKKGTFRISTEMWMLIAKSFVTIVVAFSIFSMISYSVNKKIDVGDMEANVVVRSLFQSPNCFIYSNIRIYPGLIDLNKFNGDMNSCLESNKLGIKLKLKINDKEYESFIKKDFYETENRFCGFRGYKCGDKEFPVLVNENNKLSKGSLRIQIVLKNA